MIMEILSSHEEMEEEVRVLRRNLFRILNTSEFSRSSADWVDPGAKLILRDIGKFYRFSENSLQKQLLISCF